MDEEETNKTEGFIYIGEGTKNPGIRFTLELLEPLKEMDLEKLHREIGEFIGSRIVKYFNGLGKEN